MEDRLADILTALQERLRADLCGNRMAHKHPVALGDASEDDWLCLLKSHLPHRYQADKGFVIDADGLSSEQIDIIIYDRQYSPLLYNAANQRYIPAESVYAVLEAKQDLNREHIIYAGNKAASVRRLRRTSVTIPSAQGTIGPRTLPPIIAGIIAYDSAWTPPFGDPLNLALQDLPSQHRLDFGCALAKGFFEVAYSGNATLTVTPITGSYTLLYFLMGLFKRLQALGTVPAIDYDAYTRRFSKEEPESPPRS